MKLFRLMLIFILIFGLASCAQLPIKGRLAQIEGNTSHGKGEPQVDGDSKENIDRLEDQNRDIDEIIDVEPEGDIESDGEVHYPDDEDNDIEHEKHQEDDQQDDQQGYHRDKQKDDQNDDQGDFERDKQNNESDQKQGRDGGQESAEEDPIVVQAFNTRLPEDISIDLKYDKYLIGYDYMLVLEKAKVREFPSQKSKQVGKLGAMEKVSLVAEVKGDYLRKDDSDSWYQVEWEEKGEIISGFIFSGLGEVRRFQFDKMIKAIEELEKTASFGALAYISNYKNINGIPPKIDGKTKDSFGYRRRQSAAGYENLDKSSKFRYIPDGMLAQVLEKENGFTKVRVVGFEGEYWVQDKYINAQKNLTKPKKVIIVDRKYQNEGIFELVDGQWTLVSYGFSTTGRNGRYSLETPLGYYMAIEKKDRFLYYKDGTREIDGYAPYAVGFSGGGYIHGVPVDYKIKKGKKVDPGKREYHYSIGTTPRSHMCIRNYTSQAKFIHSWTDIGETVIIVIE